MCQFLASSVVILDSLLSIEQKTHYPPVEVLWDRHDQPREVHNCQQMRDGGRPGLLANLQRCLANVQSKLGNFSSGDQE